MRLLNEQEQSAMDKVNEAVAAVMNLGGGLIHNRGELVSATHVIQSFIIQHAVSRVDPDSFTNWYAEDSINGM